MGTWDLPDIYACALGPVGLGICIRQIPHACVVAITSPTAFDHKQIIRYFYFTLKTYLFKLI